MRARAGISLFIVLSLLGPGSAPAAGQGPAFGDLSRRVSCSAFREPLGGAYADLGRSLGLTRAVAPESGARRRAGLALLEECGGGDVLEALGVGGLPGSPELRLLPAGVLMEHVSDYPRPQQDGLRWAGRGLSGTITAGIGGRWGPVTAVLAPVLTHHQNDAFRINPVASPGYSPFTSYFHTGTLDRPQRFGRGADSWANLGQSFIRVDGFGAALGVSTENLRWGPGRRNPLVMSGAGPGFFHVFAGTSGPVDVAIGGLEVEAVWGRLEESDHFDQDPDNDRRLLAGLVVAFTPAGTGLTVGAARAYQRYLPPEGLPLIDQILGPYRDVRENPTRAAGDADNQMLSVFLRWVFPAVGFEVYGEYAREDHWEDRQDLIREPDHSRGYTVGLQKVFARDGSPHRYRLEAEATNLGMSPTWQSGRPGVTFYTHSQIVQGHTHRGQLLGAPIGPGGDAQYIGFDYLGPRFLAGVWVERARYENDVYYRRHAFRYGFSGHDAEVAAGIRGAGRVIGGLRLAGQVGYSSRYNRDFLVLGPGLDSARSNNVSLTLGLSWAPDGGRSDP